MRQIPARDLWTSILTSQVETGTPYMLYKDHCNRKSNQQNLGTIKSSNVCTEVIQYSDRDEVAVCNLASIAVNMFVDPRSRKFDFPKLKEVTKIVTRNLDKIVDINYYPISEAKNSNLSHRPIGINYYLFFLGYKLIEVRFLEVSSAELYILHIFSGIGIQGLADAFLLMRYPFDSEEAHKLNIQIFETLYYGALEASCEIAKVNGKYSTFEGSPVSKGVSYY